MHLTLRACATIFFVFLLLLRGYLVCGLFNTTATSKQTDMNLYTDPSGDVMEITWMTYVDEPNIDLIEGWAWENETTLRIKLIVDGVIENSNNIINR